MVYYSKFLLCHSIYTIKSLVLPAGDGTNPKCRLKRFTEVRERVIQGFLEVYYRTISRGAGYSISLKTMQVIHVHGMGLSERLCGIKSDTQCVCVCRSR